MIKEKFWCALNPNGKTVNERKRIVRFDSYADAQKWVNDGRRVNHGYVLEMLPFYKESEYDNIWKREKNF